VTSLRSLARLLPLLAAMLVLPAQPAGVRVATPNEASLTSHERGAAPSRLGDLASRKHRQTASLEEYSAIDDDPDEHTRALRGLVRIAVAAPPFAERLLPPPYCSPRPSHRACAAPPTGPPHV
jgi:hypothetical protein